MYSKTHLRSIDFLISFILEENPQLNFDEIFINTLFLISITPTMHLTRFDYFQSLFLNNSNLFALLAGLLFSLIIKPRYFSTLKSFEVYTLVYGTILYYSTQPDSYIECWLEIQHPFCMAGNALFLNYLNTMGYIFIAGTLLGSIFTRVNSQR